MEPAPISTPPAVALATPQTPAQTVLKALGAITKTAARLWLSCASLIGSLFLIFILGAAFFFFTHGGQAPSDKVLSGAGPDKIAVIPLSGEIDEAASTSSLLSGPSNTITPDLVQNYIDRASSDQYVKAVIFRLNSPGGTIVASDQIYDKIASLKDKKIKVIFLYGDVAASGGYYISSAADKIVANPTTITGSIGVIASVLNVSGLYDKLGLKDETYKSGANKDLLNPARERTQEEKDIIQKLINQALDQFIDRVAAGRNLDKTKVRQIADGRIYSGIDAKALGLVDELGNLDKAVEVAKKEANLNNPQVVEYSEPSLIQSLLGGKLGSLNLLSLFNSRGAPSSGIKIEYLLNF